MYYQPDFLVAKWAEYKKLTGAKSDKDVDPAGFGAWGFEALLRDRLPRYERLAKNFGYVVEARDLKSVRDARRLHGADGESHPNASRLTLRRSPAAFISRRRNAHPHSRSSACPQNPRGRGRRGHGFDPRRPPGHPPAPDRPPQPDAQQGADRDPVHPADRLDAAAGRPDARPHHRPPEPRTPPRTISRPSTRPGKRCERRSSTASSSPARRSPTSRSRRCATGTRWSTSWTGRRPTCTTRCSSAGAPRPRCTTSTARGATACRRRRSASSATRW